jgi:diguanylate cyclase (GGDEF)-like protein/PAS domain S-box-containing protein
MKKNEFYKSIISNIYEGIYFVDNERIITFWNGGAERITGFSEDEVIGKCCMDNILNHVDETGKGLCMDGCPLHNTIQDGCKREAIVYLHHKDGHRVPVSVRAIPIIENDKIIGAAEIFTDESEKHEVRKDIEAYKIQAMTDQLTGLPNRRYVDSFHSSRFKEFFELGLKYGILFMDIDKFKNFNDTYGHEIGDEVLKMVSKTFLATTRSSDLIGRYGGEEFIAILTGLDEKALFNKAEQLRMLVENAAIRTKNKELRVTISIGATMVNEKDTLESIIKRADDMLYKSKENGRNLVTISC